MAESFGDTSDHRSSQTLDGVDAGAGRIHFIPQCCPQLQAQRYPVHGDLVWPDSRHTGPPVPADTGPPTRPPTHTPHTGCGGLGEVRAGGLSLSLPSLVCRASELDTRPWVNTRDFPLRLMSASPGPNCHLLPLRDSRPAFPGRSQLSQARGSEDSSLTPGGPAVTPKREPTESWLMRLMMLTQAASTQQVFAGSGLCFKFRTCREHTVQCGR